MFIINNSMLNMDIKTTQIEKIMYSFFLDYLPEFPLSVF